LVKDGMSAIDISAIVYELNQQLIGGWVNNIYQLNSNIFLFKIRTTKTLELLIEPGKRIHLTKYLREKPTKPPTFCMALRKYLRNTRISEIKQYDLDRVIIISFETKQQKYYIVAEFFREGNLILLDPDWKIVVAQKYMKMKDRNIIPKEKYNFPPSRGKNINEITMDELWELVSTSEKEIIRTLISLINVDPAIVEEACLQLNIDKNTPAKKIQKEQLENVLNKIKGLIKQVLCGNITPIIFFDESGKKPQSVEPIKLKKYEELSHKVFNSFNEAADEFFSKAEAETLVKEKIKPEDETIKKLQKRLKIQEENLKKLLAVQKESKKKGNLIYTHLREIEEIISTVLDARKKGYTWKEIIKKIEEGKKHGIPSAQMIKKINPKKRTIILTLNGEEVILDFRETTVQNASKYYDRSKKAASKIEGLKTAIEKTKKELNTLLERKTIRLEKKEEIVFTKRREKKWYEKFRWFISSDGILVIGGRDAKQNEEIIKKYLSRNDLLIHADVEGAPHVVIKTNGLNITETTIKEAAQFAVSYSRAWKMGLGAADAYWVTANQVSLSPPSGQYLRHGAAIIRGKRNYLKNIPLQLAIGLVKEKEYYVPIAGPISAIKNQTDNFVVIIPGKIPSGKLSKLIKYHLLKKLSEEERKIAEKTVLIDDIQRLIPSGTGEILEENATE